MPPWEHKLILRLTLQFLYRNKTRIVAPKKKIHFKFSKGASYFLYHSLHWNLLLVRPLEGPRRDVHTHGDLDIRASVAGFHGNLIRSCLTI